MNEAGGTPEPHQASSHDPQPASSERLVEPLSAWQRIIAAAVGLGAAGAGSAGAFIDGTNAGGIPVLLALGAAFGYIGLTGQPLARIKVGDTEATLSFVKKVAAGSTGPDELRRAAVEVLEREAPALPAQARREAERVIDEYESGERYEQAVLEALERVAPRRAYAWSGIGVDLPWDALIEGPSGSLAVVAKRTSRALSSSDLARLASQLVNLPNVRHAVLVVNLPPSAEALDFASRVVTHPEFSIGVVVWRGPGDDAALDAAITPTITPVPPDSPSEDA